MNSAVELIKKSKKADQNQDAILDTAHQLENLTKEKAEELAHELVDNEGSNEFRLGGVFSVIKANGWYEGYKDFRAYVQELFGIEYRKAQYCISLYDKLVSENISWEQVKVLKWTKVSILAPVLTADNVDMWVEKAKDVNCETLKALVKAALATGENVDADTPITTEVVKLAFTVHADQKETIKAALEKAKGEVNTEFDTVALENICLGYLGGAVAVNHTSAPTATDLKAAMKAVGWEATLEAFGEMYPNVNISVDSID
jgi:hypothetical protein